MKVAVIAGLLAMLGMATGCVTMMDEGAVAAQAADMESLRENVQRLNERLKGIELEQQNVARDMETLRQMARNEVGQGRGRVDELERQVQALKVAREQDRRQIVDDVSRKVSTIVNSGSGSSGRSSSSASDVGYEHTVQAGETLSEIARAYKVNSSAILKANNLKSPTIRVGQKLFIPQR